MFADEVYTVSSVLEELAGRLGGLDLLNRVLTNGITAGRHVTSNSQKALLLLGEIYSLLLEVDSLGNDHIAQVNLHILFPKATQTLDKDPTAPLPCSLHSCLHPNVQSHYCYLILRQ